MSERDLPEPGSDDSDEDQEERPDSAEGPGKVTVDEPTKPALNLEKET